MKRFSHHPVRRSLYMLIAIAMFAVALTAPAVSSASDASIDAGREEFVGSWQLLSFEARTGDGRVLYPFGHDAGGVVTYTRNGRISLTVWAANRQPFASGDQQKGTPEENTAALRSYVAIVGTYEVDRAAGTYSYHIEQSIFPNWNGTTHTRFFQFSDHGNRLELTSTPLQFGGTTIVAAVVWERMDPAAV